MLPRLRVVVASTLEIPSKSTLHELFAADVGDIVRRPIDTAFSQTFVSPNLNRGGLLCRVSTWHVNSVECGTDCLFVDVGVGGVEESNTGRVGIEC